MGFNLTRPIIVVNNETRLHMHCLWSKKNKQESQKITFSQCFSQCIVVPLEAQTRRLRSSTAHETGVERTFSDSVSFEDPGKESLDTLLYHLSARTL